MPALARRLGLSVLAFACLVLGACAHPVRSRDAYASGYGQPYDARYERGGYGYGRGGDASAQYGHVRSIEQEYLREERRGSEGGGAVAGAIIGGVIGNQLGRDDDRGRRGGYGRGGRGRGDDGGGRAAATLIGAVGGALIGNAIERESQRDEQRGQASVFHVLVRLDDRSERWFDFERLDGLRVGERVRVENGRLQRR